MKIFCLTIALFVFSINAHAGLSCTSLYTTMKVNIEEFEYRDNNYFGIYFSSRGEAQKTFVGDRKNAVVFETNDDFVKIEFHNPNPKHDVKLEYDFKANVGRLRVFVAADNWNVLTDDIDCRMK